MNDFFPADTLDSIETLTASEMDVRKVQAPAHTAPLHWEACARCRGTGRTRWGQCFACKGAKGKSYKTSTEDRAIARAAAFDRKQEKGRATYETFKAEHPAVEAWLSHAASRGNTFATELQAKVVRYGSLTAGQLGAVENAIKRDAERAAERTKAAAERPTVDTTALHDAFDRARANGLKRVALHFGATKIKPATKDKAILYVTTEGAYQGKIVAGKFHAVRECSADTAALVQKVAADPIGQAKLMGLETGVCCMCGAELTNKDSIERGIGPICEANWG